jgi:hypothetical protein
MPVISAPKAAERRLWDQESGACDVINGSSARELQE